ncbi:MAG: riboflavin biosynthesis protein RibF [Bacteroides sp.]|nr:riboflavin biosynthesis protein RibF [Bacteroides sp.]
MTPKAAAIGTFDGVHLGHAEVLSTLKKVAMEKGLQPIAITFDRHPLDLIAPQRAPKAITTIAKKKDLISKKGVTPVVLPFDETLRKTTAKDWMTLLRNEHNVRVLVVGYDNTFGSDGVNMSIADYRSIGKHLGMEVIEAPLVAGVSSSAIRKAVAAGNVTDANDMLGRHFLLPGKVVTGNRLGRTIGFPTANILTQPGIVVPKRGVYAAIALLPDGSKHPAMVNIGVRPTIRRGNEQTVEANIINWEGDLYGKDISLLFYSRIRDEQQFDSIDILRHQLEEDREAAISIIEPNSVKNQK